MDLSDGDGRPDIWKTPQKGDIVRYKQGSRSWQERARAGEANLSGRTDFEKHPQQLYQVIEIIPIHDSEQGESARQLRLKKVNLDKSITVVGETHYEGPAIADTPPIEQFELVMRPKKR